MKKLVLKYNIRTGKDHLPKIQELVIKVGLEIESIKEEKLNPGSKHKVIVVVGKDEPLSELDSLLVRYPSITRKAS